MSLWLKGCIPVLAAILAAVGATPLMADDDSLAALRELFEEEDYAGARLHLEGLPEGIRRSAEGLYYEGRLELIEGDHDSAAESFEQAIDAGPDRSDFHYWLAFALMRKMPYRSFLGRMTGGMKMVKEFRKAVDLDPENLRARMTLFRIMAHSYGMGGPDKQGLIEEVDAIAKIDSVLGHVARGAFNQLVEEDMDLAGSELETAFRLAPDNRAAVMSYTDYLWETNSKDEAIRILTSFVDSVPDDRAAHFSLGVRTTLAGTSYAAAESLFTTCLNLKSDNGMPSEPMVRWCLGLAYHLEGKPDRAEEEWLSAYEIDPDFDDVLRETPDLAELKAILESEP
jgi:tetratricopeptide (TPR) repeat protein